MTKLDEIKGYDLEQMKWFIWELISRGEEFIDSEWCGYMCSHRGENGCTLVDCATGKQSLVENLNDYLNYEYNKEEK